MYEETIYQVFACLLLTFREDESARLDVSLELPLHYDLIAASHISREDDASTYDQYSLLVRRLQGVRSLGRHRGGDRLLGRLRCVLVEPLLLTLTLTFGGNFHHTRRRLSLIHI